MPDFRAIDRIAQDCGVSVVNRQGRALTARAKLAGHDVLLAKPETFMNLSGLSVAALVQELGIENVSGDIIVLYDELALPLGTIRIRQDGRPNGHNGVKSSLQVRLGLSSGFSIRIGVGKQPLSDGTEIKAGGKDYLLAPFRRQELAVLDEVLDRVEDAVEAVLTNGVGPAMNEFNRKPAGPDEGTDEPKGK